MKQDEARKAVEVGCKRSKSELLKLEFRGDILEIQVKHPDQDVAHLFREYDWKQKTAEELALRCQRAFQHYLYRQPYHGDNPFGSIS